LPFCLFRFLPVTKLFSTPPYPLRFVWIVFVFSYYPQHRCRWTNVLSFSPRGLSRLTICTDAFFLNDEFGPFERDLADVRRRSFPRFSEITQASLWYVIGSTPPLLEDSLRCELQPSKRIFLSTRRRAITTLSCQPTLLICAPPLICLLWPQTTSSRRFLCPS